MKQLFVLTCSYATAVATTYAKNLQSVCPHGFCLNANIYHKRKLLYFYKSSGYISRKFGPNQAVLMFNTNNYNAKIKLFIKVVQFLL